MATGAWKYRVGTGAWKYRVGTGAYPYKNNVCNAFIVFG
jgi:hypothetical protein